MCELSSEKQHNPETIDTPVFFAIVDKCRYMFTWKTQAACPICKYHQVVQNRQECQAYDSTGNDANQTGYRHIYNEVKQGEKCVIGNKYEPMKLFNDGFVLSQKVLEPCDVFFD